MDNFAKRFKIEASPVAPEGQVIIRKNVRFTLITPCLLRVEREAKGRFCDEPTQSVWFRSFDTPKFEIKENDDEIEIKTTKAIKSNKLNLPSVKYNKSFEEKYGAKAPIPAIIKEIKI